MSDYVASQSRSTYYKADSRVPSRLWAAEKAIHDLAEIGLVDFFEGPGTNPTLNSGYASDKIWLRQNPGVQPQQGQFRVWTGDSPASNENNWVPLTSQRFFELIVGGVTSTIFPMATQPEAEARVSTTVLLNPLRGGQLFDISLPERVLVGVTPARYGYSSSGTASEKDAAMQAWQAAIKAGAIGYVPAGVFEFLTPLDFTGSKVVILGASRVNSILRYKGTNATADIFKVGGTVFGSPIDGGKLFGFQVQSDTIMSAGSAIKIQHAIGNFSIAEVSPDERSYALGTSNLFHGVTFENTNVSKYSGFLIAYLAGDGIRVYGRNGADTGSDLVLDLGTIVGCNGVGLHQAGGFGGLYVGRVLCFNNYKNFRVSNDVVSRQNREIFVGEHSVFDGGRVFNIEIDDPLAAGGMIDIAGFVGSAGLDPANGGAPRPEAEFIGDNIRIKNWNGTLAVRSPKVFNAKRHGVMTDDADTIITIYEGSYFGTNQGTAVNSSVPTTNINCKATFGTGFFVNGANYGANVRQLKTFTPVVTAASGSLTTVSGFIDWRRDGAFVTFTGAVSITANGTGAGAIGVTLPWQTRQRAVCSGKAVGLSNKALSCDFPADQTYMIIQNFDGTYPGATNEAFVFSGTVEVY